VAVKPGYQREGIGTQGFGAEGIGATAGIAIVSWKLRATTWSPSSSTGPSVSKSRWAVGYYRGQETALRMALLRLQSADVAQAPEAAKA